MKTTKQLLFALSILFLSITSQAGMFDLDENATVYANNIPFQGLGAGDTLMIHGTFIMNTDYTFYQNTGLTLIVDGPSAKIHWTGNYALKLGSGSSMYFYNGGDLTVTGACNNNKSIFFGTIEVAACVGGNQGVLNFADIVYAGGIDSTGNALPVEWLGFSAKSIDNAQVSLEWSTALEENNSHFEIEYSSNGVNWEVVGSQKSYSENGFSNQILYYNFMHQLYETPKQAYYRIKQIDFNGNFDYSIVELVKFAKQDLITINTLGNGNITLNAVNEMNQAQVRVIDLTGRVITSTTLSTTVNLQLDQNSVYIIEVIDANNKQTLKHFVR